jgi:hypothetical protein
MRMLIVGKMPATVSVNAGHYFQGRHGSFLWSELRGQKILQCDADYEDDCLLANGLGITDVVKVPRDFGQEPSPREYGDGWPAVAETIERLKPAVTFWPHKGALDNVLRHAFGLSRKARYGFNPSLNRSIGASVFVFGMIGTRCSAEERIRGMRALRRRLGEIR